VRCRRSPVIAAANPTSPTTANILLNPPTTGGPVSLYDVRLCPLAGGGRCVSATSPTINCRATGLTSGATYRVSALAVVGGKRVPASNMLVLTMPDTNSPTLISAVDTSGYTGQAVAAPPPGTTFIQVCSCYQVFGHLWGGMVPQAGAGWLAAPALSSAWNTARPACCSSPLAVHLHRKAPERRRACEHHQLWAGGHILWPHSRHPDGPREWFLLYLQCQPARSPAVPACLPACLVWAMQ
jgi:hypothetical protein